MSNHPYSSFLRSIPTAPNIDVSQIKGNLDDEGKQITANIFWWLTTGEGAPSDVPGTVTTDTPFFSSSVGRRIKMVELDVWPKSKDGLICRSVGEIVVERGEQHILRMWPKTRTDTQCMMKICAMFMECCTEPVHHT